MSIVECNESGVPPLPAEDAANPSYALDVCDGVTVLRLVGDGEPAWKNPDPAERVKAFLEFAESPRPPAPDIPLEYLDREHIYD